MLIAGFYNFKVNLCFYNTFIDVKSIFKMKVTTIKNLEVHNG